MVFNSLEFAVFFSLVLLLYHSVGHRLQNLLLLAAGYVFYGAWDTRFLFLVSVSTVLDYCTGLMIARGVMSARQRLMPSLHVLGFALTFLVLDWSALHVGGETPIAFDAARFFTPRPFGIKVFALALLVVLGAHAVYPWLSRLPEARRKLFFLRCSLFGQLGLLAVFKYYNFFADGAAMLATRAGLYAPSLHLDIVLPIGISFYTFQTLSYVCDVYFGRMQPVDRLRDFALFSSYFPPLVAGPIERASHLIPKLLGERKVTADQITFGAFLILLGLFKKTVIADGLAGSVASVYGMTSGATWLDIVAATLAFTIQIYGDFSGYSDIASGVSLFLGIELLKNFDLPYFSTSPSEFWRRWHISLSTWLRDYLYVPLGGNRGGEAKTYRNLMLTMVLGGLWHGAAWNFVLWGAYHGLLLVIHRALTAGKPAAFDGGLLARLPRIAFFMPFVCYGWLLFRAESLDQILTFTKTLGSGPFGTTIQMKGPSSSALLGLPVLVALELGQLTTRSVECHRRLSPALRGGLYALLTILFLMGTSNEPTQFIYFQF